MKIRNPKSEIRKKFQNPNDQNKSLYSIPWSLNVAQNRSSRNGYKMGEFSSLCVLNFENSDLFRISCFDIRTCSCDFVQGAQTPFLEKPTRQAQ
jgi:hypothetical protein